MAQPIVWTAADLRRDAELAKSAFRIERLTETLELYNEFFETFAPIFRDVIRRLPDLTRPEVDPDTVAGLVRDIGTRTAFRYLTAPPISEDDLRTLAETSLSPAALRRDPSSAKRVRDIVLQIVDPHRFGWIVERRSPSPAEEWTAVVASAAMVAARKVETARRSDAKRVQEEMVGRVLIQAGLERVSPRSIPLLDRAPEPGQFCGESMLGPTRADVVVRLYDRRVLPLECKVSNSAVNSFKRVNHEAAGKASRWLIGFGRAGVVPAAMLSGVFNPINLSSAQELGLNIFWSHRPEDLVDFVLSTRP